MVPVSLMLPLLITAKCLEEQEKEELKTISLTKHFCLSGAEHDIAH